MGILDSLAGSGGLFGDMLNPNIYQGNGKRPEEQPQDTLSPHILSALAKLLPPSPFQQWQQPPADPNKYAQDGYPPMQQGGMQPLPPPVNVPSMRVSEQPPVTDFSGQQRQSPSLAPPSAGQAPYFPPQQPQQQPQQPLRQQPGGLATAFQNFAHSSGPLPAIADFFSGLGGTQTYNQPTLQKTGTDPFTGQDTFAWANPQNQTLTPANPSGAPAGMNGMSQFSNAIRSGVGGEQLMNAAPPEIKGRLQAMLEGREAPPTGAGLRNPQVQALINAAHAIDPTFDETSWGKRNDFIKQLQKGSNNTLGGQRNSGNTALAHLSTVAEKAADLGNVDLGGYFPAAAGVVNAARQAMTTEQAAKANAFNDAIDRYVTEVGRYYAGSSSGGVAEREAARKRFSSTKTPQELSAAIQAERELFQGKLQQMEEQRNEALGPYAKNYSILMPHGEAALKSLDKSLEKMRSGTPAASPQQSLPQVSSPADAAKLPKGSRFLDPQGNVRVVP